MDRKAGCLGGSGCATHRGSSLAFVILAFVLDEVLNKPQIENHEEAQILKSSKIKHQEKVV